MIHFSWTAAFFPGQQTVALSDASQVCDECLWTGFVEFSILFVCVCFHVCHYLFISVHWWYLSPCVHHHQCCFVVHYFLTCIFPLFVIYHYPEANYSLSFHSVWQTVFIYCAVYDCSYIIMFMTMFIYHNVYESPCAYITGDSLCSCLPLCSWRNTFNFTALLFAWRRP